MRNIALFKWSKWDHKSFWLYYNQNATNEYKAYVMLKFMHTAVSQTVKWKTVGDFAKAKVTTFGIELGSFDEIGTLFRFFNWDDGIFKEETSKGSNVSFLHKDGQTMEKCLVLWKVGTGMHYIGIDDRKEKFKMMFTMTSSELRIMAEYVKYILQNHRDQDINPQDVEETAKFEETAQPKKDDDIPF